MPDTAAAPAEPVPFQSADAYVRVTVAIEALGRMLDRPGIIGTPFSAQLQALITELEASRLATRDQIDAALGAPPDVDNAPPSPATAPTPSVDLSGPAVVLSPWRNGIVSKNEAIAGVPLTGRARVGSALLVVRASDRQVMYRVVLPEPGDDREGGGQVTIDNKGRVPFTVPLTRHDLSATANPGSRAELLLVGPAPADWGVAGIEPGTAPGVITGDVENENRALLSAMLANNDARLERFVAKAAPWKWEYHDYQPLALADVSGPIGVGNRVEIRVQSDAHGYPAPEQTVIDILVAKELTDGRELFKAFDAAGGTRLAEKGLLLGHLRAVTEDSEPTVTLEMMPPLQALAAENKAVGYLRVQSLRFRNYRVVRFALPYGNNGPAGKGDASPLEIAGSGAASGPYGKRYTGKAAAQRDAWSMPQTKRTARKSGGVSEVGVLNDTGERYAKRPTEGRAGARGNAADRNVVDGSGTIYSWRTRDRVTQLNGTANPAFVDPDEVFYMDGSALMLWKDGRRSTLFDSRDAKATTIGAWEGTQSADDDLHVVSDNDPVQNAYVYSRSRGPIGTLTQHQLRADCQRLLGRGKDDIIDWVSPAMGGQFILVRMKETCFMRYDVADLSGSAVVIGAVRNGKTYPVKPGHSAGVLGTQRTCKHGKVHWLGALWWDNAVPDRIYRIENDQLPGGGKNHLSGASLLRPDWLIASVATNGNVVGVKLDSDRYAGQSVSAHKDFPIDYCSYTVGARGPLETEFWGDPQKTGGRYPTASATPNPEGNRVWMTSGNGNRRVWMQEAR